MSECEDCARRQRMSDNAWAMLEIANATNASLSVENKELRARHPEALSLLRELVDIYRRSNGSVEELYEAMGRAYALVAALAASQTRDGVGQCTK